ncbi:hypothetical protein BCAMP_10680 [Brochothrix campestris FSL F6-1037]|uniref:Peptidase M41 domain-containing protein n=1 Tax=Brochothrix campestris FSL F6-1037 TaxID=1265861 RepID=W7CUG7_9LIST|nr:hypothetical protein BCAMP_10680 [Brochothrix campestris FSL F6-1037]
MSLVKKERTTVAYHEAGHTIIGTVLDEAETVHKVTIVPRGQAGGYAVMMPKEDRFLLTKNELLDRITGLLGGRVAEDVTFGEVSTGASNDFERATEMAHRMVTEWGMSDKIGPLQFKGSNDNVFLGRDMGGGKGFSDQIAFVIDSEVQRIINECYARAKEILTTHQVQLETIAQKLLEIETLNAKEIRSLFDTGEMPVAEDDTVVAEAQEVVVEAVGDADVAATVDEQVIEKTEDKQ